MHSQFKSGKRLPEHAGYFEVPGAHLYTVLHEVEDPVARVLLVGPFASERLSCYLPWVRWARYLAVRQIEVLRYDYRGIGESTGVFSEMTFADWCADVRLLSSWLKARSPSLPLLLHGLELGAVLTGREFQVGVGDALLLWSAPRNANQALRSTLLRAVGPEQLFRRSNERKTVSDFIRRLESGSSLEVDGYQWSARLWRESFDVELPAALAESSRATAFSDRPVRIVRLDKEIEPPDKCGFTTSDTEANFAKLRVELASKCGTNFSWHHSFRFWAEFRPYFEWLFMNNYEWIAASLGTPAECQ